MLLAAPRSQSRFQHRGWPFAAIALCAAVAALAGTSLLLSDYASGLLVQSFLFGLVALITDVIWGYAGILTFASAAMFGIGAYAVGVMIAHIPTLAGAATLAAVVAALAAAALSAVVGWLAFYSRTRVSEFYVAVVTLGLSVLFGQMVLYGGALTGGSNGLSGFATVDLSNRSWYLLTGFALIGAIFVATKFVRSDFGLLLRALRDHEQRCRYLGVHAAYVKTVVFTAGNAVVALVGVLYALFTTVVAPSLVGIVLATNVLIWVTLGGRATIVGPVIAAVLVNAATPQLSTSMPLYWQGVLGLSFLLVVVLLPRGLLPGIGLGLWGLLSSFSPRWRVSSDLESAYSAPPFETGDDGKKVLSSDALLEVRGVSKSFGSFHALSNVDLQVRPGELISIVGPNGAGKTSLVRCISDGIERDSGTIAICAQGIGRSPPDAIVGLGLGRKFQGASIFGSLTVKESLKLSVWKGRLPGVWRRDSQLVLPPGAAEVVNVLGLKAAWNLPAKDLSHGQRQALELAMVLALEPKVLLLDEPTAGLSIAERGLVGDLLVKLADTGQLAIVLIEHDFEFVKRISSRIVVMVSGRLVADGSVAEISESKLVREAYLGVPSAESEQ